MITPETMARGEKMKKFSSKDDLLKEIKPICLELRQKGLTQQKIADELTKRGYRTPRANAPVPDNYVSLVLIGAGHRTHTKLSYKKKKGKLTYKYPPISSAVDLMTEILTSNLNTKTKEHLVRVVSKTL